MKSLLLSLCLGAGLFFQCKAQHLQRRPFLGVQVQAVPDSVARANKLKTTDGAWVRRVIPNSTAAALKLQPNDLITKVNGKPVAGHLDVVTMARQFSTGQPVTLELVRKGKTVKVKGTVQPMPYESAAANAEIRYDEVALGNNAYARSIIKKLKGNGKFPVVFYISGYSCYSVDNLPETDALRKLVDGLVARGYAVYRMEKPGVGDSRNPKPCEEIGYLEEVAAFQAGLKALKQYDFVDADNVFLFGHSLGGHTGPLIAAKDPVKGIITYGAAGKTWGEYMIDVFRMQRAITGTPYEEIERDMNTLLPLTYEFLWQKKTPDELVKNPKYRDLMDHLDYDGRGHMFGRHYTFMQELHDVPLNQSWKQANAYTLAIYGEADVEAINPAAVQLIADVVNSYHPGKATAHVLPRTNHGFIETGTQQDHLRMQQDGSYQAYSEQHFNTKLLDLLDNWIKDKLQKKA